MDWAVVRTVVAIVVPLVGLVAVPALRGYVKAKLAERWREGSEERGRAQDARLARLEEAQDAAERRHVRDHTAIDARLDKLDEALARIEEAIQDLRRQSSQEHKEASERLRLVEREVARIKGFSAGRGQ